MVSHWRTAPRATASADHRLDRLHEPFGEDIPLLRFPPFDRLLVNRPADRRAGRPRTWRSPSGGLVSTARPTRWQRDVEASLERGRRADDRAAFSSADPTTTLRGVGDRNKSFSTVVS
jgi:hypothetical protein